MLDWMRQHDTLLWWLMIASVITFVGSLLLVPWIAARIPVDYFTAPRHQPGKFATEHPLLSVILLILRNLLGVLILIAGIAMLVLPGQGLLTMAVGLMLINFPGKYRLERWVIRQPVVFRSVNWLRAKHNREPLKLPKAKPSKIKALFKWRRKRHR